MIKKFLEDLCFLNEAKNKKNSKNGSPKITPRANYIKKELKKHGIKVKVDSFLDKKKLKEDITSGFLKNIDFILRFFGLSKKFLYFYNLEVFFPSHKTDCSETVVFVAHHDICNVDSENCQDNTASVANLMNLCVELKKMELKRNVLVVFTDCEEYGFKGAYRLVQRIEEDNFGEVKYIVNSELTAKGDTIWCESKETKVAESEDEELNEKIDFYKLKRRTCPPNDSVVFRNMGISSYCFGLLPSNEFDEPFPKTWRVCHSKSDQHVIANANNMENYIDFLKVLI